MAMHTNTLKIENRIKEGVQSLLGSGDLNSAETFINDLLSSIDDFAPLWVELGRIRVLQGKTDLALSNLDKALTINNDLMLPNLLIGYCNAPQLILENSDYIVDLDVWNDVIDSRLIQNLFLIHKVLISSGKAESRDHLIRSIKKAYKILSATEDVSDVCITEINNIYKSGFHSDAIDFIEYVVKINPENPSAFIVLSSILYEVGQSEYAELVCWRCMDAHPHSLINFCNLITILDHNQRKVVADHLCKTAPLEITSTVEFQSLKLKRLPADQQIPLLRELICANGQREFRLQLMNLLLAEGNWAEAWEYHRDVLTPLNLGGCEWNGEPLAGKTLLVHSELGGGGGYGDIINLSRYVIIASRTARKVTLVVPESIVPLYTGYPDNVTVIEMGSDLGSYDYHISMFNLLRAFKTTPETIPSFDAYFYPNKSDIDCWGDRFSGLGGKKVGIMWSGNKYWTKHFELPDPRKAKFSDFLGLLSDQNVDFVNLQVGPERRDILAAPEGCRIHDFPEYRIGNFARTAALISYLDLVISIDTSVAHLAAALGKPVWLLLPYAADWRWLKERDDTPWYPSVRIFRQKAPGVWKDVIDRVREQLPRFCRTS